MKTIYLVKKDPTKEASGNNWIVMNAYEFHLFMLTDDGKRRRSGFGQLDACSVEDCIIVAECGNDAAKQWKKEKNRQDYRNRVREESGYGEFSYDAATTEDDTTGEELLADEDANPEEEAIRRMELQELRRAIALLQPEDRDVLEQCYLRSKPLTIEEYAKLRGIGRSTAGYRKKAVLEKLKRILLNNDPS